MKYNLEAIKSELEMMQKTCIDIYNSQDNPSTDMSKEMDEVIGGVDFIASELQIQLDKPLPKSMSVESFRTLCLSTCHMTNEDNDNLEELATESDMIMSREHGFWVKLYTDMQFNMKPDLSDDCNKVIKWAFDNGYQMIEFDSAADKEEELFTVHEW